ncbi:conserved hypothetical protein [Arthrobacter sp. Hiyo8]|nr:conserved hypothetical protein [Arthrobacter sp. Hiyo8]
MRRPSRTGQLAANVQHFIQDRLPIALIFAGLPSAVSDLLNEGVATFLRRADKIDLHAAAVRDVETSFTETFAAAGITIDPDLVHKAATTTGGYPFLIQLVGYFLWREAENNNGGLSSAAVDRAIAAAIRRNERVVIEAASPRHPPKTRRSCTQWPSTMDPPRPGTSSGGPVHGPLSWPNTGPDSSPQASSNQPATEKPTSPSPDCGNTSAKISHTDRCRSATDLLHPPGRDFQQAGLRPARVCGGALPQTA